MAVQIRKMIREDAADAAMICVKTGLHSWSEASFIRESENPIAFYFVLEDNEVCIGFAGIWCVADEAQVMNIGILPDFQGNGYGKMLMTHICQTGADAGCSCMTLEVKAGNIPAIEMYTGMGFRQTGLRKNYYPDHSDGILMEKVLCNEK